MAKSIQVFKYLSCATGDSLWNGTNYAIKLPDGMNRPTQQKALKYV
ncbi:MAG: hypothetical protein HY735_05355 [Verrucomicrobia bacterium]|nr:hypothetical protein [Verrucomicrobiota bacterium]